MHKLWRISVNIDLLNVMDYLLTRPVDAPTLDAVGAVFPRAAIPAGRKPCYPTLESWLQRTSRYKVGRAPIRARIGYSDTPGIMNSDIRIGSGSKLRVR